VLANSFSVNRSHVSGIWKLKLLENPSALDVRRGEEILLKLQDDGFFLQCNNNNNDNDNDNEKTIYVDRKPLFGCWEYQDYELKLALDRRCSIKTGDVLLTGRIQGEDLTIKNGIVETGKFMYSQEVHHKFWRDFDNVMAMSETTGTFSLRQTMSFYKYKLMVNTRLDEDEYVERKETATKFEPSLFFGKKFFMTIEPIESKAQARTGDQAVDIRTMPIQFFANRTFEAIGINKILRGRYEITKDNALSFHVSRFGMGRSTPGSVYSEGVGLSHEDERTYVGSINHRQPQAQQEKCGLKVQGKVTFGADLGSDARPEPVGTFLMIEVDNTCLEMPNDDPGNGGGELAGEDAFDSVFEQSKKKN